METKICSKCKAEKPLTEFGWRNRKTEKSRYSSWCKSCETAAAGVWQKANWNQIKVYRDTDEYRRSQKDGWLRLNYHKSLEWFEEQLAKQGGVCGICGKPEHRKTPKGQIKALAVDHDHACCSGHRSCGNCVRGLICESCNHTLGNVADKVEILQQAILYLQSFKKEKDTLK